MRYPPGCLAFDELFTVAHHDAYVPGLILIDDVRLAVPRDIGCLKRHPGPVLEIAFGGCKASGITEAHLSISRLIHVARDVDIPAVVIGGRIDDVGKTVAGEVGQAKSAASVLHRAIGEINDGQLVKGAGSVTGRDTQVHGAGTAAFAAP